MEDSSRLETIHNKRQRLSALPRACEGCKTRKIRCDRSMPCSNCQVSGITCQKAEPGPEKRPKQDQKSSLEETIVVLENRLRSVETKLIGHKTASESPSGSTPAAESSADTPRVVPISNMPVTLYEGDSSFSMQSAQARETAETLAHSNDSGPNSDLSNIQATIHSLKSLLQPASQNHRSSNIVCPPTQDLPLSAELVVTMLRWYQDSKSLFLTSYPVNDIRLIERLCQKVYFPMRPVSSGTVAAMHGILYFLMKESIMWKDDLSKQHDLKSHMAKCKESFEAGIENYDVLTIPSFENIIALVMGIMKAQDEAKPLVSCHLVSTAARHCQMLGYHRESTYKKDSDVNSEHKRRLFWTLYVFDKTMSLLLGRASYMQDFDMDVNVPSLSSNPAARPWDEAFEYMIRLAKVEGEIYNRLYSASALKASAEERTRAVNELIIEMEDCQKSRDAIDYSRVHHPDLYILGKSTWDILHYSTLTNLLRAPSSFSKGNEIGSQCFEAARRSLQTHLKAFPYFSENDSLFTLAEYANWILLYASFTPFIVIFLHAIAATSMEDVKLLDDVVATLFCARTVSLASDRLYGIGANFARVARGLVEAQKSCVGEYNKHEDTLQLLDDTRKAKTYRPNSSQDQLGLDLTGYLTYPEAQDMSALFGIWDSGQPSAMDIFGLNGEDLI